MKAWFRRALVLGGLLALVASAYVPLVEAHNAVDAIARDRGYFGHGGSIRTHATYRCDQLYRVGNNPEDGPNAFCVDSSVFGNVGSNVKGSGFLSAVINTTGTFNEHYDCRWNINLPSASGTTTFRITGGGQNGDLCSYTYTTTTVANEVDEWNHWIGSTNGALDPTFFKTQLTLEVESSCCTGGIRWTHIAYYTGGVPFAAPIAKLEDLDRDSKYHSMDDNIYQWNISDPGGDDLLLVAGVDVTPPIGGNREIEPGVTATRGDAGNGDVLWNIVSSLTNKRLVISVEDEPGRNLYRWDVRSVVS